MDEFHRKIILAAAEAAECVRDLGFTALTTESNIPRAASAAAGLARAAERIQVACGQPPSPFPLSIECEGKLVRIYDVNKLPLNKPFTIVETCLKA